MRLNIHCVTVILGDTFAMGLFFVGKSTSGKSSLQQQFGEGPLSCFNNAPKQTKKPDP